MMEREKTKQRRVRNGFQILLGFMVVIPLLLAACSPDVNDSAADPTYTHQGREIKLPEEITSIMSLEKTDNGNLLMLGTYANADTSTALIWELASDESWKERADLRTLLPLNSGDMCTGAVITKNERVLSVFTDMSEQNRGYRFFLIDFEPELEYRELVMVLPETLSVQNEETSTSPLKSVLPISDDLFLIQDKINNLFILDCVSETIVPVSLGDTDRSLQVLSIAKLGEEVFVLCEGVIEGEPSITIRLLDVSTNTLGYLDEALDETLMVPYKEHEEFSHFGVIPSIESDPSQADRLTICTGSGLYEFKNNQLRKIADAEGTTLSNPSQLVIGCVFDNQDDFYLLSLTQAAADMPFALNKYERSEVSAESNTELRVYSLKDNAEVRQAVAFFKEEHPDVEVALEIGLNSNSVTQEDALQILNTEIMAGTGPDILFLDGLPVETFVEQGVLYDLTDIYEEAIASDSYYENVISSFVYDGKCKALPMRFSLPLVVTDRYSADNLDGLTAFVDTAKTKVDSTPETALFCNMSIIDDLFVACYPEIINQGAANENSLAQFFESVGDLSILLESNDRERSVNPAFTGSSSQEAHSSDTFNDSNFGRLAFIKDPNQILIIQPDYEEVFGLLEAMKTIDNTDTVIELFALTERKSFLPRTCVAINGRNNEIQLAEAFVRTMLSENFQNINQREGLSIQKTVFSNRTTRGAFAINLEDGGRYLAEPFSGETIASYESLFASLDTPIFVDQVIQDAIYQELQRYLDGEVDLKSAVNSCSKKLNLYLAE